MVTFTTSRKVHAYMARGVHIISCASNATLKMCLSLISDSHRAGRDAARAFATGCFATHRTYDIRGLDEREMKVCKLTIDAFVVYHLFQGLHHWKNFFATHKKYKKIGRVLHRPIDPASPIPEPCQPEKAGQGAKKAEDSKTRDQKHVEL